MAVGCAITLLLTISASASVCTGNRMSNGGWLFTMDCPVEPDVLRVTGDGWTIPAEEPYLSPGQYFVEWMGNSRATIELNLSMVDGCNATSALSWEMYYDLGPQGFIWLELSVDNGRTWEMVDIQYCARDCFSPDGAVWRWTTVGQSLPLTPVILVGNVISDRQGTSHTSNCFPQCEGQLFCIDRPSPLRARLQINPDTCRGGINRDKCSVWIDNIAWNKKPDPPPAFGVFDHPAEEETKSFRFTTRLQTVDFFEVYKVEQVDRGEGCTMENRLLAIVPVRKEDDLDDFKTGRFEVELPAENKGYHFFRARSVDLFGGTSHFTPLFGLAPAPED